MKAVRLPAIVATVLVGVALADPLPAPMPAPPVLPTPEPHVQFGGGDGRSCDRAIVIAGARHESEGVRAERWWVYTKNPGAKIASQSVAEKDGKALETITILGSDGSSQAICFDITSFFGKP
jgi:hypothetical protein